MASIDENSAACRSEISNYRDRCCGSREPGPIAQIPTRPPVFQGERGPYQNCNLCWTGDYPYNTAMVINMLYIGVGSCPQYYGYGQNGWIQNHLCSALQHFAYEPCGCGEFNPTYNGNGARPPPASSGTPQPIQRPLKKPTSPPLKQPTGKPPMHSMNKRNLRPNPEASKPPKPKPFEQPMPQPSKRPSHKLVKEPTPHQAVPPTPEPTSNLRN
jgi:hypothetical protein